MFLNSKQKSLILVMLSSISLYSCGMKKSNDTDTQTQDVPVPVPTPTSPGVSLEVTEPTSLLYVSNISSSLSSSSSNLKASSLGNLYYAVGNGGLGANLTSPDALTAYPGVPVVSTLTDLPAESVMSISVIGTGDAACANAFSYDSDVKLVKVDSSKITTLTLCNVEVDGSATHDDKNYTGKTNFKIALNPTMRVYYETGDVGAKYLKDYIPSSDADSLAAKLKENTNLSLRFDSKRTSSNITNINVLTGFKSVTSLDLSGTNLSDLRAITYLTNLTSIDISNTKVDPKDIVQLASLPNLKSLAVRNLSIQSLSEIASSFPNLESLDISGTSVSDLSPLSTMKHLKVLKLSGVVNPSKNLQFLKGLISLNKLDLSNSDLSSSVVPDDSKILANLNLQSLNVSQTHIPDAVLNDFFALVENETPGLNEFIDRNKGDMSKIGSCGNLINNFDNISNIRKATSLINLDLHGNSCNIDGDANHDIGLKDSIYFTGMLSLQTLDISDTVVSSLLGLQYLHNLKAITVADPDGGIDMSREVCLASAQKFIQGVKINCMDLPSAGQASQAFSTGSYSWTVPANVWEVTVTGCSGANGASGAGGGGGGDALHNKVDRSGGEGPQDSLGGTGGVSGIANGSSSRNAGAAGSAGTCTLVDPVNGRVVTADTCGGGVKAGDGNTGGDGVIGSHTLFGSTTFSLAASNVVRDSNSCFGGISAAGGSGGGGQNAGGSWMTGIGGSGGVGGHGFDGWNSPKETHVVSVNPGDTIQITVGAGGGGGAGGTPGAHLCSGGDWFSGCGSDGLTGGAGGVGQDGTLTVTWQK